MCRLTLIFKIEVKCPCKGTVSLMDKIVFVYDQTSLELKA